MSKPQEMTLTDEQLKLAEKLLKEKKAAAKQVTVAYVVIEMQDTARILRAEFAGGKKTAEPSFREDRGRLGSWHWGAKVYLDDLDKGMPKTYNELKDQKFSFRRSDMRGGAPIFSTLELARAAVAIMRMNNTERALTSAMQAQVALDAANEKSAKSQASLESDLVAIAKMEPVN